MTCNTDNTHKCVLDYAFEMLRYDTSRAQQGNKLLIQE